MWSIYDTCILLSGVITAVIAVLPLSGIAMRTRAGAGLVGGGLIVISLFLGNLPTFRYPSIVLIGPLIALCVLGAVIWDARRDHGTDAGRQFDETASGADPGNVPIGIGGTAPDAYPVAESTEESGFVTRTAPAARSAQTDGEQERVAAWAAVHDPATSSERLAEIVGRHPEFAPAIAAHPNCYPEPMDWMREADLVAGTPDATAVRPIAVPPLTGTTTTVVSIVSAPRYDVPVAGANGSVGKGPRRWVVSAVGAVAALLVLGVVLLLMPRGGAPATASVQSSTYPSALNSPPSAISSPTLNSEPPSASPESDDVLSYTCWNGKEVDSLERCIQPTGVAGLKYIYPSMNEQWSHCKYAAYRTTTATHDCTFADGVIRYRYWKDAAEADRHYRQKYATGEGSDFVLDDNNVGALYRATKRDKGGKFTMTARWGGGHYSLSMDAKTRAGQDALWETVRFRALSDLRGHFSESDPGEAERE